MIVAFARKIRGLSAERQEQILQEKGYKKIYVDGREAEDFDAAKRALRKGEALGIVVGHVLGDYQRDIYDAAEALFDEGKGIHEVSTDRTAFGHGNLIIPDAYARLRGLQSAGSKKEMQRRGSEGGKKSARVRRKGRMPKAMAEKIWFDRTLDTDEAVRQINSHPDYPGTWGRTTLFDKLGGRGVTPGPKPKSK